MALSVLSLHRAKTTQIRRDWTEKYPEHSTTPTQTTLLLAVVSIGSAAPTISSQDGDKGGYRQINKTNFTNYLASLTEHALEDIGPRGTAQAKLAILGISCRLPGATDLEQ